MPTIQKTIAVYANEKTRKKAEYIAKKEGRSLSNYIQQILKEKIEYYENEKGEIEI